MSPVQFRKIHELRHVIHDPKFVGAIDEYDLHYLRTVELIADRSCPDHCDRDDDMLVPEPIRLHELWKIHGIQEENERWPNARVRL